ncbi:MAG: hypothetical protein IPP66_00510 [Anaerolineales bacterium]|nr:hypothetical protein [Anaerolineales bacterium]
MSPLVAVAITWVLVIARFIIAIQLTRIGRHQKLPNLLWLAGFFYITGLGDIFFTLSPFTNFIWPFFLSVGLGEIMLVMFIHTTFYQGRKSPYLVFMVIAFAFLLLNVFSTTFAYWSPFNWIWLIVVGYRAYKQISTNLAVEDWVKIRYKLVIAYSLVTLFLPLYTVVWVSASFVPSWQTLIYSPVGGVIALMVNVSFTTLGVVLAYLAWVMPENYRRFLNRNYKPPVQDAVEMQLSEEEIINKLKA